MIDLTEYEAYQDSLAEDGLTKEHLKSHRYDRTKEHKQEKRKREIRKNRNVFLEDV